MTFSPSEQQLHGTPLSLAQDASRLGETPSDNASCSSSDSSTQSLSLKYEKGLWRDSSEQTLEVLAQPEDLEKKAIKTENSKEAAGHVSQELDHLQRPDLGERQTTVNSIAAAPYVSHCCDLERPHSHGRTVTPRPRSSSSSSSSAPTLHEVPSNLAAASRVSTDAYGNSYPEGGKEAWLCVFGSFCGLMSGLG